MYPLALSTHSILRYAVLLLLVSVIIRFAHAKFFKRQYNDTDDRLSMLTVLFAHLQLVLGAILYFISPVTKSAMANMGAAMQDENLRFWAVEHVTLMVAAVILITFGRIRSKSRGLRNDEKFRRLLIFYSIGLVLIIAGIPWERLVPQFLY